jgi:O-antigen ligase
MTPQAVLDSRIDVRPRTNRIGWAEFEVLALWALVMAGYPVVGILTATLDLDNAVLTYPFRALCAALAVVVMARAAARRELRIDLLIIVFALLYTVRLLYDWLVEDIPAADFSLALFWLVAMLPAFGLASSVRLIQDKRVAVAIAIPATLTCLLSLSTFLFGGALRGVTTEAALGRLSFATVNAITVGYTGLYLVLASFVLWWGASLRVRGILLVLVALGIATLLQTGSRGPLVAGALCVAAVALVDGKQFLFWVIMAGVGVSLIPASADIPLLDRLVTTGVDNSSLERFYSQQSAWDQAWQSPLLGHAYVETDFYTYPHILLLESALAMGVVGLVMMAVLQLRLLNNARHLMVGGQRLIPFIALSAFANAWLSGAIWGAFDFWVGLASMSAMVRLVDPKLSGVLLLQDRGSAPRAASV